MREAAIINGPLITVMVLSLLSIGARFQLIFVVARRKHIVSIVIMSLNLKLLRQLSEKENLKVIREEIFSN